jgi:hypothetical protein
MFPVTAVHKQVQQRAQQQKQVRQDAEKVGSMLGYEKESGDGDEGQKNQACPRAEPLAKVEWLFIIHRKTPRLSPGYTSLVTEAKALFCS